MREVDDEMKCYAAENAFFVMDLYLEASLETTESAFARRAYVLFFRMVIRCWASWVSSIFSRSSGIESVSSSFFVIRVIIVANFLPMR